MADQLYFLCRLMPPRPDFMITMTLSAADAAAHVVHNPFAPHWLTGQMTVSLLLLGLLGATFLKGFKDVVADPAGAIETVYERDPLIDKAVEGDRLALALEVNILTAWVEANGFGDIDPARMARAIDQLVAAYALPSKPAVDDIWTSAFLPPAAERTLGE